MGAKVSVIIPVYNAEKYLEECLNSVVNSTLKNIEIICVDDGSTDSSLSILQKYAANDLRVKILRQKNLYAGRARNNGLMHATGEYVHFLDADDWIASNGYREWYAIAKETNADACICFHEKFDNITGKRIRNCPKLKKYIETINFSDSAKYLIYNGVIPWNKLYKREFLLNKGILFDDLICANDRSFHFRVIKNADIITVVQEYWMYYRINNNNSLIGKTRLKHYDCHFKSFMEIWELFKDADDEIKRMILDISFADFMNFYRKAKGTKYEKRIKKDLYRFFKKWDLSLVSNIMCTKHWYKDYIQIMNKYMHPNVVADIIKTYEQRDDLKRKNAKLNDEKNAHILKSNAEIKKLSDEYDKVISSRSYKLGRALSWPYRKIRGGIWCYQGHGFLYTWKRLLYKCGVLTIGEFDTWQQMHEEKMIVELNISPKRKSDKAIDDPKLIVSLTSYPGRINTVHKTIETLLAQTIKPDKVILWLAKEQFPKEEKELPKQLLALKSKGLTIDWCEDLKSYKKLIPALRKYPEAVIVTADDDAYYASDWLELLYNDYINHKDFGNYIYCHRITKFFKPDENWHIITSSRSIYSQPTYLHKLVGLGGVLYPPHSLYSDVMKDNKFKALAPTNDDIWFWFMAILNRYKIKVVPKALPHPKAVEGSQDHGALTQINDKGENLFWKDFYTLIKEYPMVEELLEKDYAVMHRVENMERIPQVKKNEEYYKSLRWEDRPAELMLWYHQRTGKFLDLENPETFNEKIQWLKLYDSTLLKTRLADKYLVRRWVKDKIGEKYLIPLLGVWKTFDDINFDELPDQFVLKTNHGSGSVLVVSNKMELDKIDAKNKFDKWLKKNYGCMGGQELHYWNIKPVIIAEKFIDSIDHLCDYKFLCFNGEVKYIWVDSNRFIDHRRDFFDINWNHISVIQKCSNADHVPKKPDNMEEMIHLAQVLSQGFSHVRVDFYNIKGKIYFGEMTFTSANGGELMDPQSFDKELGSYIVLPRKTKPILNGI